MRNCAFRITGVITLKVFILSSLFWLLLLPGCTHQESVFRESRLLMDTVCTITVVETSRREAMKAIEEGFGTIERLEGLLNYYSPGSEISAINRASGIHPVKASGETLEIIKEAVSIAETTGGAFDPTIGPVMKLWDFGGEKDEYSVPPVPEVRDALRFIDYREVVVNREKSEVFLRKAGMELDLGGIAKGYAADKAIDVLRQRGVKAALVAIAGDIRGFGLKPDGRPWKVGIQNPRSSGDAPQGGEDIFGALELYDRAISTSGDYQRFFIEKGKRYHHLLDPKTGFPARDIISVSVMAPEGFLADAFSTGVFVLGREKGLEILEAHGFSGVVVDGSMKIYMTDDLKGRVKLEKDL